MTNKKHSLLWEISGKKIVAPSYLFGTMHVKDNRAFRNIDFLAKCIHSCSAFAAEFDLKDSDPQRLQEATTLPKGSSLKDYLNPRVYKKVERLLLKETGHQLEHLKHNSPILLFNLISEAQFQEDNAEALDNALYNIAQEADKNLMGLETFEEQMSVFAKVNLEEQCRSLKKMATHFVSFKREIKKTSELYIQGDLQKLLKKAKQSIGGMRQVLLYDRNIIMAERFESFTQEQSLFAAIGAGHLGGKKGVLSLLKKKGYTIKPVSY